MQEGWVLSGVVDIFRKGKLRSVGDGLCSYSAVVNTTYCDVCCFGGICGSFDVQLLHCRIGSQLRAG